MGNKVKSFKSNKWDKLQAKKLSEPLFDTSKGRYVTNLNRQQSFSRIVKK